jgi:hypothetical protein
LTWRRQREEWSPNHKRLGQRETTSKGGVSSERGTVRHACHNRPVSRVWNNRPGRRREKHYTGKSTQLLDGKFPWPLGTAAKRFQTVR